MHLYRKPLQLRTRELVTTVPVAFHNSCSNKVFFSVLFRFDAKMCIFHIVFVFHCLQSNTTKEIRFPLTLDPLLFKWQSIKQFLNENAL